MKLEEDSTCSCGSINTYNECCGRFHSGKSYPITAEELMRSRYSAYVKGDAAYLFKKVHPEKRNDRTVDELAASLSPIKWKRLDIVKTSQGRQKDKMGKVEFIAYYDTADGEDFMHEISRFRRYKGRWVYYDGVIQK